MSGLVSGITGISAGSFGLLLVSFFVAGPTMIVITMVLQIVIFAFALISVRRMRNAGLTRHTPTTTE